MAWLPGVSPRKAVQLAGQVLQDPMSVHTESGLPSLAHANVMAAAFEAVDATDDAASGLFSLRIYTIRVNLALLRMVFGLPKKWVSSLGSISSALIFHTISSR